MYMIQAIVRPSKSNEIISELLVSGYPAMTKMDVYGRGKQKGIVVGSVQYDEIPKEMLIVVCKMRTRTIL